MGIISKQILKLKKINPKAMFLLLVQLIWQKNKKQNLLLTPF